MTYEDQSSDMENEGGPAIPAPAPAPAAEDLALQVRWLRKELNLLGIMLVKLGLIHVHQQCYSAGYGDYATQIKDVEDLLDSFVTSEPPW